MIIAQQAKFMTSASQARTMQTTTLPATAGTQLDISSVLNLMFPILMIAIMSKMVAGGFDKQEEPETIQ